MASVNVSVGVKLRPWAIPVCKIILFSMLPIMGFLPKQKNDRIVNLVTSVVLFKFRGMTLHVGERRL